MKFGRVFGFVFFIMFFCAAFTSSIGATEGLVAHLRDEWRVDRRLATFMVVGAAALIGILAALSADAFSILGLVSTYSLVIGGLLMTVFVGWVWPIERFLEEAHIGSPLLRRLWVIDVRYVIPSAIVLVLLQQLGVL